MPIWYYLAYFYQKRRKKLKIPLEYIFKNIKKKLMWRRAGGGGGWLADVDKNKIHNIII